MTAWQVPIFAQGRGQQTIAHLFPRSDDTHRQVMTACGIAVTPGFAVPRTDQPKCKKCEAAK